MMGQVNGSVVRVQTHVIQVCWRLEAVFEVGRELSHPSACRPADDVAKRRSGVLRLLILLCVPGPRTLRSVVVHPDEDVEDPRQQASCQFQASC